MAEYSVERLMKISAIAVALTLTTGGYAAGQSLANMPGVNLQIPASSSVTHDTMHIQDPEDPAHRTGKDQPAPDLLRGVAARPAKSLAEFLAMADKANPTIAQAHALARRSAALGRQASLYPNPTVGYQGDQIRGGRYGGGEQGGFVQQTIVLGGKLGLRRDIYTQQSHADEIGVEEQTLRVHNDVAQAFYSALTAQALVSVRKQLLGVAQDAVETVHQLANVGQADAPDILQTEVEAEQAKVDYATAQREFLAKFRMLAAEAGVQQLDASPLQGEIERLPEIDAEQKVATILANSPEMRHAQQEVAVAEARRRDARRESIPDLQLRAGEQYNGELISENPRIATGAQSFASAGIMLPLWNRNQGNKAAADVEIERARQEVTRTELSLRHEAEPLAQSYEAARFTAERYRTELIPRAQRAHELYLKKYQDMAQAYPQVLVSQRTLFQLQVAYLTALGETWKSAVALENFTLSGGLVAPSSGSASVSIAPSTTGSGSE